MAKTRSLTRNQNRDTSFSSRSKRVTTFDNGGLLPWADLNDDVLYLVLMQLGYVDFFAFSGVCKSWRTFALTNKNIFMMSKPPIKICIRPSATNKDSYCYLKDFDERRRFRTILPHSAGSACIGLTCGYLILFGRITRDFWLVNPITRHELHFPNIPLDVSTSGIKAILVHSPSISRLVFVMLHRKVSDYIEAEPVISYSIEGKQGWNRVSSTLPTPYPIDIHFFKGKIYTLHKDSSLRELRPAQMWTLLEINSFPQPDFVHGELLSSPENLYMINRYSDMKKVLELDFGEMKWVSPEKAIREYAFFIGQIRSSAAIKPESWAGLHTQYKTYGNLIETNKHRHCLLCYYYWMWYFPHDCLNVNLLSE